MAQRILIALSMLSIFLGAPLAAHAQMPGGVQVPQAPQMPGTGSLPTSLPSKDSLLDQAKGMVSDLTSMKSSGKLDAAQTKQVDGMLPKAQSLTSELEKPQVPPNKLTQLASSLSDLQKQLATLKGLIK
jgi:hypothetical protein